MPYLYETTTFDTTQPFCLLSFLRALDAQLYAHLRSIGYYYSMPPSLVTGHPAEMRDWTQFCTFFATTFDPKLTLFIREGFYGESARIIRRSDDPRCKQWLYPLLDLAKAVHVIFCSSTGDSGAFYGGELSPEAIARRKAPMTVYIDVNEVRREYVDDQAAIDEIYRRLKASKWNHKPYGKLIGGE